MVRPNSRRLAAMAALLVAASGCGGGGQAPQRAAVREPPARIAPAAPVSSVSNVGAVWRLRGGLNVAALTCRGRGLASVTPGYNRLLSRHAALFTQAHAEEQRRHGIAGFDRAQTRHYNRMAYQRSPVRFCATAAEIAGRAHAMESTRLAAAAPDLAGELEAALR